MNYKELREIKSSYLQSHTRYTNTYWKHWNYNLLSNVLYLHKAGRGDNSTYNDCVIMLDTETSKKIDDGTITDNHVVFWTISIRVYYRNLVTLHGTKPSECIECIKYILGNLSGEQTFIYVQNLQYDWTFLRKFFFKEYGYPDKQLNVKSHYPIYIKWESIGLTLKDSLILSQRSLSKWGKDMNVEHQKATGSWDYDKIRNQNTVHSDKEIHYAEFDTLCGVECIDATLSMLGKKIYSIPYTATGIPREETRKRGGSKARELYQRIALTYSQQINAELTYHGGYTHTNRHLVSEVIRKPVKCYDFASSYPFRILANKFPMGRFTELRDCSIDEILIDAENYAYMFKLIAYKVRLKDDFIDMPILQFSKCVKCINPILDNGRILAADYVEIYLTEIDLKLINDQYQITKHRCVDVLVSNKDYLPKWLTDYVYELYEAKCKLKGVDDILYTLSKYTLNSIYGMFVQKPVKPNIIEDYDTGEYVTENSVDLEDLYNKHINKRTSILPYQWGIWVTAYSLEALFDLGSCAGTWIYSDTDSCYGLDWDCKKLEQLNTKYKQMLLDNGYGPVNVNEKEFWIGVAEFDGEYSEYVALGAKRYCGRSAKDNKLHITVAGVPKVGAECLNDDINNFKKGFQFAGARTGKKTHTYFYVEDIYIDENGNECGDSIDLSPCDYLLDDIEVYDWEALLTEEVSLQLPEGMIY